MGDSDSDSYVSPPRTALINFSSFGGNPELLFSQDVEAGGLSHPPSGAEDLVSFGGTLNLTRVVGMYW